MSNLVRNDVTIEGANVREVLQAIGFNPGGAPIVWGAKVQPENIAVLIDFNRITPRPNATPKEGWRKWVDDNWGGVPYDGYEQGDLFELSENRVSFKFYTKNHPAFPVIETLAKAFPAYKVKYGSWELTNHLIGEAAWENGNRKLYVPMFQVKLEADMPANDPVTDDMRNAAADLVQAALEACPTCTLDIEAAKTRVAGTLAASERPIKVEFETNVDGSHCLYIDAGPACSGGITGDRLHARDEI